MALNLNASPYYDDFTESSKYHKILFKPGVAVQARELTQLQTILQDQFQKGFSFVVQEGTVISGCAEVSNRIEYIKVNDTDNSSTAIDNTSMAGFVGDTVGGGTTGITAEVLRVATGTEAAAPLTKTLYLKYTSSGSQTKHTFLAAEVLTVTSRVSETVTVSAGGSGYSSVPTVAFSAPTGTGQKETAQGTATVSGGAVTKITITNKGKGYTSAPTITISGGGGSSATATATLDSSNAGKTFVVRSTTSVAIEKDNYFGISPLVKLSEGIIYARGAFIKTDAMDVLVNPHGVSGDRKVGFVVTEAAVNSATDTTLLDPAAGSYNANAPGADRLKLSVTLASYNKSDTIPENFYTYMQYTNGIARRSQTKENPLAGLGQILANRTMDESGNYVVKGLQVTVREHLENTAKTNGGYLPASLGGTAHNLVVEIAPGKAYVGGFKRELLSSKRIILAKPKNTRWTADETLSTAAGTYVEVNEVCGYWDIDSGAVVDLYGAAQDAITGGAHSADTLTGSIVGKARIRHIKYSSGTVGAAAAVFKLYLYDIKMASGDFSAVKSIVYEHAETRGIADTVLDGDSLATLKEAELNKQIYRLPRSNVRTIKTASNGTAYDNSFTYQKEFDGTLDSTNGNITITTSGDETFNVSGTLTDTQIVNNFTLIAKDGFTQNSATIDEGQMIDLTSSNGNSSVTVNSSTSVTIDTGGAVTGANRGVRIYATVKKSNAAPMAKALASGRYVKIDTGTHLNGASGPFSLGIPDGHKIESITAGTNSDYTTGQTDVTKEFKFNTGQKDNTYGLAKLFKTSSSTTNFSTNRYIVVKFTHFSHTKTSATYFSVDSYPVNDSGTTFLTQDIPLYSSAKHGDFDLRNCIDFRPLTTATAVSTQTLGSATVNPDSNEVLESALTQPDPAGTFTTDFWYYLGKGARVICDYDGEFRTIYSTSQDNPVIPPEPENSMSLAEFILPPWPALSLGAAKLVNRHDLTVNVKQIENKHYTMKDISQLENRISNLEYYASLNLLEKAAKDQKIVNSSGIDRFKNGILVDPFTGHNIGSVTNPDYNISIDDKRQLARPRFDIENMNLIHNNTNFGLTQRGALVTLPFETIPFMQQNKASGIVNVNGEDIHEYFGNMELVPPIDNFVDISTKPDVLANFDGNYDAWEKWNSDNSFSTSWGSWENVGASRVVASTVESVDVRNAASTRTDTLYTNTVEQNQTRTGVRSTVTPQTTEQRLGQKLVNSSIAPYMRSIQVTVTIYRLKPNTRHYPFFDGTPVTAHCKRAFASGAVVGEALYSDAAGTLTIDFVIPQGQFRTGARVFKVTDSKTNNDRVCRSRASAIYESSGLQQEVQDTIVSMRTANFSSITYTDDRTITDTSVDRTIGAETPISPPVSNYPQNSPMDEADPGESTNTSPSGEGEDDTEAGGGDDQEHTTPGGPPGNTDVHPDSSTETLPTDSTDSSVDTGTDNNDVDGDNESPGTDTTTDTGSKGDTDTDTNSGNQTTGDDDQGQTHIRFNIPFGQHGFVGGGVNVCMPIAGNVGLGGVISSASDIMTYLEAQKTTAHVAPAMTNQKVEPSAYGSHVTNYNPLEGGIHAEADGNAFAKSGYSGGGGYNMDMDYLRNLVLHCHGQTFKVTGQEGGVFIDSIDLFFKNKPLDADSGITMEIREVVKGMPGPKVVPHGTAFVGRNEIALSTTSGGTTSYIPTNFRFDSLVYLKNNTQYCFIPSSLNAVSGYDMYIAKLGDNEVGTTTRIDKQPHEGMMFTNSSSLGAQAIPDQDFMFRIHRARFDVSGIKTAVFNNDPTDYITFKDWGNSITTFPTGQYIHGFDFTITNAGTAYSSTPTVTVSGGGGTGLALTATMSGSGSTQTVSGLTVNTSSGFPSGYTSAPTVTIAGPGGSGTTATATITLNQGYVGWNNTALDYSLVKVIDGSFQANDVLYGPAGYATISSVDNRVINDITLNAGIQQPLQTNITASMKLTPTGGTTDTAYQQLEINKTKSLSKEYTIYSRSNEVASYSGNKTAEIKIKMSTSRNNVSPAIDRYQFDLLSITNKVNNDNANETNPKGGNATSKYISRTVVLEDGQDAEDIKVYLTASVPNTSSVEVYGKFLNGADDGDFEEDINWTKLTVSTEPKERTDEYAEYSWTIPTKSGGVGTTAGVLEYDVGRVLSIAVSGSMSGYNNLPTITISGGGGTGATANATVAGGAITAINIVDPGRGYTSAPTVTITPHASDSSASGAAGTATVGTTTYKGYKSFAVKVVPLSSSTVSPPFFKELRAIALQA